MGSIMRRIDVVSIPQEYSKPRGTCFTPIRSKFRVDDNATDVPFKYYGDEKIEEVNELYKLEFKSYFQNKKRTLQENEYEDHFIISIFKEIGLSMESIKLFPRLQKKNQDCYTAEYLVKRLRIEDICMKWSANKGIPINHFQYLSCLKSEDLSMKNIQMTFKELFCVKCKTYDCQLHGISIKPSIKNNYDPIPKMTYKEMIDSAYSVENLSEGACCENCYKLKKSQSSSSFKLNRYDQLTTIQKLKYEKFIKIYQFDPCKINILLNLPSFNCTDIYQNLHKKEIQIKKPLKKKITPKEKIRMPNTQRGDSRMSRLRKSSSNRTKYNPCFHPNGEKCGRNCPCYQRGFCEKYCFCSKDCPIRFKGCNCKTSCKDKLCPCRAAFRECDPDLCKHCFETNDPLEDGVVKISSENKCSNYNILQKRQVRTAISNSRVCEGFGLFSLEYVPKKSFIGKYLGEITSGDESNRREIWYNYEDLFYLFTLNTEEVIDAKHKANRLRFVNHSKNIPNIEVRVLFSNGDYHIAFFAKNALRIGEEMLFDYDGQNELGKFFPWINKKTPSSYGPLKIPSLKRGRKAIMAKNQPQNNKKMTKQKSKKKSEYSMRKIKEESEEEGCDPFVYTNWRKVKKVKKESSDESSSDSSGSCEDIYENFPRSLSPDDMPFQYEPSSSTSEEQDSTLNETISRECPTPNIISIRLKKVPSLPPFLNDIPIFPHQEVRIVKKNKYEPISKNQTKLDSFFSIIGKK